jgi:hypothetical protein
VQSEAISKLEFHGTLVLNLSFISLAVQIILTTRLKTDQSTCMTCMASGVETIPGDDDDSSPLIRVQV